MNLGPSSYMFLSPSHLDLHHGVRYLPSNPPDFSQGISRCNSTKGLQSRSRKWLFAMTIIMFVLSSAHWIMTTVSYIIYIGVFLSELGPVPRKIPYWVPIMARRASAALRRPYIHVDRKGWT